MARWSKDEALTALRSYAAQTDKLSSSEAYSTDHTRWIANCLAVLEEVFGPASRYFLTFASLRWQETGSFVVVPDPWNPQAAIDERHHQVYLRDLQSAKGLLLAAADDLARHEIDEVYKAKDTGPESSMILRILNLAERKLRKTIRKEPANEREIHDAFENLLIGAEMSYGRETERIEYSSKTYTPDFTLSKIELAIEMKLCKPGREKDIIAEINDDILAYKTRYPNLLFIVYDLGGIRDVERFVASFEQQENITVRVVKH